MAIGPGTRIRNAKLEDVGTLACILRPRDRGSRDRYLLSAGHVLNPGGCGDKGDAIEAEVAQGWIPIATLVDWTPINGLASEGILIDAGIALLDPAFATGWQAAGQAVAPRDVVPQCYAGMGVQVYGAETALLTAGTVHSVGGAIHVDYRVEKSGLPPFSMRVANQIFYGRMQGGWLTVTQGGDSGALVTDPSGLAIGMHIGSTNPNNGLSVSVCTPIQRILDRFDLELDRFDPAADEAPAPVTTEDSAAPALPATGERLSDSAMEAMGIRILPLLEPHNYKDGVAWQLTPRGVMVDATLPRTGGQPRTVARVWTQYAGPICRSAKAYQVPVELIVATICTESHGNPLATRVERDGRVSAGLMQTLLGTARAVMRDATIDEAWLKVPDQSIEAGTACIANERRHSAFDPPLVAAIYNAGSLRELYNNRWHFAQYVGSHTHADSFIEWFNDCFAHFDASPPDLQDSAPSFWKLLKV